MSEENKDETQEEFNLKKEIIDWIKTILFAFVFAFIITQFIIVNATVPTGSMKTTINEGDRLIANRLSYIFSEPKRGDIVVFKYPDNENILYIKRIIGLPGDEITLKNEKVYINGDEFDDSEYAKGITLPVNGVCEYTVPEGCYFMLGDNRENSLDSRFWENTFVKKEKIEGKALFRYWKGKGGLSFKLF